MTVPLPLTFASDDWRLLTGLGIGVLFGFALERGGFANARKLAAQFYLYDMTVFKVMFTAILVAMVGLYTLAGFGIVDLARLWINPTFVWAQVVGGLLLGFGFILSGLCPGTSVVSLASGRWDGLVTMIGIVLGTALFAVAVDLFPAIERLYEAGGTVSLLPDLFHVPAPWLVLGVVIMAGSAFVGAEKVEALFRRRYGVIELTPEPTPRTPRVKFAVAGALAGVVLVAAAWRPATPTSAPVAMSAVMPLEVAEALIARTPGLLILDLRADPAAARGIPGAYAVTDSAALELLRGAPTGARVVVYDEVGTRAQTPAGWPDGLRYEYVRGGLAAWHAEVLTPVPVRSADLATRDAAERQHAIAAFLSGTSVAASAAAAPPAMPSAGGAKKKKAGGC
jgi:hypothetical protein